MEINFVTANRILMRNTQEMMAGKTPSIAGENRPKEKLLAIPKGQAKLPPL
jgi:hypothetical protein